MNRTTNIIIKTASLILVFVLVLSSCVVMLSFAEEGKAEPIDRFSSPDIQGTNAPVSRESLEKKFSKYNTETTENGKKIITVYDTETITDILHRKSLGAWLYLTTEEMLYLIENTVEMFKTYDIIRVYDKDGNLLSYYGLSFYSSEEYLACFNGFDYGINDISFDMKEDIFNAVFARAAVLNSAVYDAYLNGTGGRATSMITDMKYAPNSDEANVLSYGLNPWSKDKTDENGNPATSNKHYGVWIFDKSLIWFSGDSAEVRLDFSPLDMEALYPEKFNFDTIGQMKYDQNGKVIVAEVYDSESRQMIARVRFDEINDPEIIEKAEKLQEQVFGQMESTDNHFEKSDYYIVLHLNGFESDTVVMHPQYVYFSDGDLTKYDLYEDGLFMDYTTVYSDGSVFASYMNEIIKDRLEN